MLRALRAAATFSALTAQKALGRRRVLWETYGSGPSLLLGFPLSIGRGGDSLLLQQYLRGLTESYRVIVMDYPPSGRDADLLVHRFTPDRVCADILAVADEAGADRFAWYGYSWGGLVGLQLAARTARVTALVCGGFPPVGASYGDLYAASKVAASRSLGAMEQLLVTFFRDLESWDDREALAKLSCQAMTFAGTDDVVVSKGAPAIRIGPLIGEHRAELEERGWTVRLVPGHRHQLYAEPDIVVPLLRSFLDPVLLQAGNRTLGPDESVVHREPAAKR